MGEIELNRNFLLEDFQALTAIASTPEKQAIQINGLRRLVDTLEQRVEVLENCRRADYATLRSFQKRLVQQQGAIAHLESELAQLRRLLNSREAA